MVGIMARLIYFLCILLLFGCQTDISSKDQVVKGNSDLKTSDGVLDLSQYSQEQQKAVASHVAMRGRWQSSSARPRQSPPRAACPRAGSARTRRRSRTSLGSRWRPAATGASGRSASCERPRARCHFSLIAESDSISDISRSIVAHMLTSTV